jgi:TonB-dependent receptor
MTDYYLANPSYFTTTEVAQYNTIANNSKYTRELISAGYIRTDTSFFEGRLKVVGGLRAEQTNIEGQGNRIDATANYQRDAAGNVLTGSNGQPLLIHPAGSFEATKLTNQVRAFTAEKEYLRWFPSLNATYNLSDDFLLRGGYFQSVGRPSFLQYAGSLTLPNLDSPPSSANRISVNNVGIKAWQAESYKVSLEYYFKPVGLFQISGFVRDIENFFATTVFAPTPEFLAQFNLDPTEYGAYEVSTQRNLSGTVRMTGFSVDYKQSLTFLPDWARGFQVFGNFSSQRATGAESSNFAGYIPKRANWGATLTRPKFTLRVRWNYESRSRLAQLDPGRSIGPAVYNWRGSRLLLTLGGEYRLSNRYALFFDSNNTTDEPQEFDTEGPQTPDWAVRRQNISNIRLLTIGLKGNF